MVDISISYILMTLCLEKEDLNITKIIKIIGTLTKLSPTNFKRN